MWKFQLLHRRHIVNLNFATRHCTHRKLTIQVKALSKVSPVPLGTKLTNLFGDFFIICRKLETTEPECFVLTPAEVAALAHRGEKEDKVSFWLQPKRYAIDEYREKWERIGTGFV